MKTVGVKGYPTSLPAREETVPRWRGLRGWKIISEKLKTDTTIRGSIEEYKH